MSWYDYDDYFVPREPEYLGNISKLGQLRHNINLADWNWWSFMGNKVFRFKDKDCSINENLRSIINKVGDILGEMYESEVHGSYNIQPIIKDILKIVNIVENNLTIVIDEYPEIKKRKIKHNGKKKRQKFIFIKTKKYYNIDLEPEEFYKKYNVNQILDDINTKWQEIVKQDKEYKIKQEERQKRYEEKAEKLKKLRQEALGVGTRKIKLRLNKLAKQGKNIAKLLRLLLELEDINIKAKQTIPYYREKVYKMKDWHIKEVINFLKEIKYQQDYGFKADTDLDNEAMVFYLDLPGTNEQVSWHTYNNNNIIPKEYLEISYNKDWIGETEETTYERILKSIDKLYGEVMRK